MAINSIPRFSDHADKKAKEDGNYLWKLSRFPLVKGVTNILGDSVTGIINGTRSEIDRTIQISRDRETQGRQMEHALDELGASRSKVPRREVFNIQTLWGGRAPESEINIRKEDNVLEAAVYIDVAPCKITTEINGKTVSYNKGDQVGKVLKPEDTSIENRGKFYHYLRKRAGQGILNGPKRFLKGIVKYIGSPVVGLASAVGAGAAINAGLGALGAPGFMLVAKTMLAAGTVSVPGVAAAAATAIGGAVVGYKLAKLFFKLIRRNKANLQYAAATQGSDITADSMSAILDDNNKTLAKHIIKTSRGRATSQSGDLIINARVRAKDLGVRTIRKEDGEWIDGFYDGTGKLFQKNDIVPKGTVVPHGTVWENNGVVPAATEYRDVKPFTERRLPTGQVKESIRIDSRGGADIPGPLVLGARSQMPFSYLDKRDPHNPVEREMGRDSEPGSVVDVRHLPEGTIIPAGSYIEPERVSEGEWDINEAEISEMPTAGIELMRSTGIRRDIELGENGMLIPTTAQQKITLAGATPVSVGEITGATVERNGRSYKKYQPDDGILRAGSQLPAGTIVAARAALSEHYIEDYRGEDLRNVEFPVNQAFSQDIQCRSDQNLFDLARQLCGAGNEGNLRLRLGHSIPWDQNTIPTFVDPETRTIHYISHEIPAGTCIPANQLNAGMFGGNDMVIPEEVVIPGGSEIYDVTTRRPAESLAQLFRAATIAIQGLGVGAIRGAVTPDQYQNQINAIQEVQDARNDLQASNATEAVELLTQLDQAVQNKVLQVIRQDIQEAQNEVRNNLNIADHNPPASTFISTLQDHHVYDELHRANQAVGVAGEQEGALRTQLQNNIISRIRDLTNQMISTDIIGLRPGGGWPAGDTAGKNIGAIQAAAVYGSINQAINEVTENVFDGNLEADARTYAEQQQRQLQANLRDEVSQVATP